MRELPLVGCLIQLVTKVHYSRNCARYISLKNKNFAVLANCLVILQLRDCPFYDNVVLEKHLQEASKYQLLLHESFSSTACIDNNWIVMQLLFS